jgi:hypothetical protein
MARFPFTFAPLYRPFAALFGVVPATAYVSVDDTTLVARFGPWLVRTPRSNVRDTQLVEGFGLAKTLGPAHLSLADRGLTMATNRERGVCVRFITPVPGLEPTGRLQHPGLTVTVEDCPGLIAALEASA